MSEVIEVVMHANAGDAAKVLVNISASRCGDSSCHINDVGGSPDVSIVAVKSPHNATSELSDQEMHGPRLAQGLAALGELSRAISVLSATAESSPASAVSPPTSKKKCPA